VNLLTYALGTVPAGVIVARVNQVTGAVVAVDGWVNDIHPEDMPWFLRHWGEDDAWDYWFDARMRT
jgi:hypothetical protein